MEHILVLDLNHSNITKVLKTCRKCGAFSIFHDFDDVIDYSEVKGVILACEDEKSKDKYNLPKEIYNYPILEIVGELDLEFCLTSFIHECGFTKPYNIKDYTFNLINELKENLKDEKVLLALSGGVDSSVVCALLSKAIGNNLTAIFVNHGLLRYKEEDEVINNFKDFDLNFKYVDESDYFLNHLKDVIDPEVKRKIIGEDFINVFVNEANKLDGITYLAQGTIYPDIIESGTKFHKVVKSHHNVGGLPSKLNFKLVEPLNMLFKDEVREMGLVLGLSSSLVYRQPFPGPGLGVRCLNGITKEKLLLLKKADYILREEIAKNNLNNDIWQYFCVFPSLKTVGVRDNKRAYEDAIIIRCVNSVDAMTAYFYPLNYDLLRHISYRITHEVIGINRVLLDVTDKPVGTIEFE